jgi:hypothetical protein
MVLSVDEIVQFLEAVPGLRNRGGADDGLRAGLRVGEVARPGQRHDRKLPNADPGRAGQGRQRSLCHAVAAAVSLG